ncbi:hypothetical protein [Trichlorobacter lovleyi]|uniref:hypothetical protein n=1 Tax=Trichlorobacter lovleyi TaxID=313985 RepID=UPI003D0A7638
MTIPPPIPQQYLLTVVLHNLTLAYRERFGVLAFLLAGLLLSAGFMLYPGSFLATPALILAMTLLLAPPVGFMLSLRTELEWLFINHFCKNTVLKKEQLLVLRSSQMVGNGLIVLLAAGCTISLYHLGAPDLLQAIPACIGLLLVVWVAWVANQQGLQMRGSSSIRCLLLASFVSDVIWCGGVVLLGWLFILALRHSLLAELNLMMMFF